MFIPPNLRGILMEKHFEPAQSINPCIAFGKASEE
jgi:hypothetical protein